MRNLLLLFLALTMVPVLAADAPFGFGRAASVEQVRAADTDLAPWGQVPAGSGGVAAGEALFAAQCASCHGVEGGGGLFGALVANEQPADFARNPQVTRTVGNYWPYATTLYDFIYRAMPQLDPGSLSADETYALVAYLLFKNGLIGADTRVDGLLLQRLQLPGWQRVRWSRETIRMAAQSHRMARSGNAAPLPTARPRSRTGDDSND